MTPEQLEEQIAIIVAQIENFRGTRRDHTGLDGFLYNGGVVLTLACTGIATILGAKGVSPELV